MKQISRAIIGGLTALFILNSHAQSETVGQALRRGDAEAARAALSPQIAGRKDADLHRAHLEGMIALRMGDVDTAIKIFRGILAVAPAFEPSRLGLIKALEASGQRRTAITQARRLASQTEDSRLRDQLLNQIAMVEGARRGGVALRFALLPSTNITGGTAAETVFVGSVPFTLDAGSREASGVGLTMGATAWRNWPLGKTWSATASASVDLRIFDTALKPDETDVTLRLDATRRGSKASVSFGPRVSVLFQDRDRARTQIGLGLNAIYLVAPRLRFFLSAEFLKQAYPQAAFRNGDRASVTPGLQYALSPQTVLTVELPMIRETARARHLGHKDLAIGIGLTTQLSNGLNLSLGVLAGRNEYDAIYPGFTMARTDHVKSLRLSISHNKLQIRGLMPELSVSSKWQASNIPLHDVRTTDFGFSLSRRF